MSTGDLGSRLLTAVLALLLTGGVIAIGVGVAWAVYANSPANRRGNPLADIGVAYGVALAVIGGLVALPSFVALVARAIRVRRR